MSDLAQKLIAENKRTRSTFLDLGNCGLNVIPKEVGDLVWLERISFSRVWSEWIEETWEPQESQNLDEDNLLSHLGPLPRLSRLKTLILSGQPVSDLAPLASLSSLENVDLSNTQVIDLTPITKLSALKNLKLVSTQITNLTPIAKLSELNMLNLVKSRVVDLEPIANLYALRALFLSVTGITDLAPIANLSALRTLFVSETRITNLAPIANLSALQTLVVSETQITDLAPIANLSALQDLHLSETQVAYITPIASLSSIQTLNLSNTRVTDLTPMIGRIQRGVEVKLSEEYWEGPGIYVKGCPLTNPPVEIAAQGNEAILNYFAERARGQVDHLYEAKMLILGKGGAGKTSLLRRLYQPGSGLPAESDTTRGIEIHKHEFKLSNGRTFRLNVWDFGGQQIYSATHQFFLTHRSLYILLDDTREDHKSASDEGFRSWFDLIDIFGGHSPTLIFQNEKGGRSKAIDFEGIRRRYTNVERVYQGNLEDPRSVDSLRDGTEFYASHLSHIGEELPASWIEIRGEIEHLAAKRPYIPIEEYLAICTHHLKSDEARALYLSRYLHDLGVFLHFQNDPLLRRIVILQNEWATTAVFRVLDDEVVKKKLGRFSLEDCQRLWRGTGYDHMHLELLALMQNFELCYEQGDTTPRTWLVPQLLPPAKPAQVTNWAQPGDLTLRYKYDFLPKGMISRLTVRKHRFVRDPEQAWVTGVLFAQDSTEVLVEILAKGNEIELRARGPENKGLLSVIAAELDALNDSFQGLRDKVDKRIPCKCQVCSAAISPEFYSYKELVRGKELGRLQVECRESFESVSVIQMLDGIKVKPAPAWTKDGPRANELRTIQIFLASSSELREDRDAFDLYFRQQNDDLLAECIYLKIVRWETFLDAMSGTRLQDEYNRAVRNCDIFVSLFFTKAGKYTQEEFEAAFGQFRATEKPFIYTYFKSGNVNIRNIRLEDLQSLKDFESKVKALGHFPTEYEDITDLKLKFRDQLPLIREQLKIN